MTGEVLVIAVGSGLVTVAGLGSVWVGTDHIPGVLRKTATLAGASPAAARYLVLSVAVALAFACLAAGILRFGLLGFDEHIRPFIRGGRERRLVVGLLIEAALAAAFWAVFTPFWWHRALRRTGRRSP